MPYLASISIYPVKSLDGVSVRESRLLSSGALVDDRRFALFDSSNQYVNGKRNARVHLLRSSFDSISRTLTLWTESGPRETCFHLDRDQNAMEAWLGEFFGFPIFFREDIRSGFPDDTNSPGPTLISSATLREVGKWFGLPLEQVRRRFRANLEVDGVPPFWEDQLYSQRDQIVRFSIGEVLFDGINPCQRCVVPARDATSGTDVPDFARRFVELRKKFLPAWADRSRFNHFFRLAVNTRLASENQATELSVGDPIEVIGPRPVRASQQTQVINTAPSSTRWSGMLEVSAISQDTPEVRIFRLALNDGAELPFEYLPGQHLNIQPVIDGTVHKRCYTIASAPTQRKFIEIAVKREGVGTVSQYLHDHVQKGMQLRVSGPGGKFVFTGKESEAVVLIGAGVGITPLMSILRYLMHCRWPGRIDLIYCAKDQQHLIFKSELDALARTNPNFNATITLTRESSSAWTGRRGRISAGLLGEVFPFAASPLVYLCGPLAMATEAGEMLRELRVPAERIRTEAFGGALPAAPEKSDGQVIGTVTFTESGRSIPLRRGQTILQAATEAKIEIDHGCIAGVCGRCKVRLLSGDVQMSVEDGLDSAAEEQGYVLACQAKARGSVAVEM